MSEKLSTPLDEFKERELEILNLMASGMSNQEMANELFITKETIRWYNKQIYSKLGTNRRIEAIAIARDMGFIKDEEVASEDEIQTLRAYFSARINEWNKKQYDLNKRFVNLTLLIDRENELHQRWQTVTDTHYDDLSILVQSLSNPAMVLLGSPGSGKSSLLRHFQLMHSREQLQTNGDVITFFIQLNGDQGNLDPREWLQAHWSHLYPQMPSLDDLLDEGRVILLSDALNEISHNSTAEYYERVGHWRLFTQFIAKQGNRAIYSCRSLDYSTLDVK